MSDRLERRRLEAQIAKLDYDIELALDVVEHMRDERNRLYRKLMGMGPDE